MCANHCLCQFGQVTYMAHSISYFIVVVVVFNLECIVFYIHLLFVSLTVNFSMSESKRIHLFEVGSAYIPSIQVGLSTYLYPVFAGILRSMLF